MLVAASVARIRGRFRRHRRSRADRRHAPAEPRRELGRAARRRCRGRTRAPTTGRSRARACLGGGEPLAHRRDDEQRRGLRRIGRERERGHVEQRLERERPVDRRRLDERLDRDGDRAVVSSYSRATRIRAASPLPSSSASKVAMWSSSQRLTVRAPHRGSNASATARARTAPAGVDQDAALAQAAPREQARQLLVDDALGGLRRQRPERHDVIDPVPQLGREELAHRARDLGEHAAV